MSASAVALRRRVAKRVAERSQTDTGPVPNVINRRELHGGWLSQANAWWVDEQRPRLWLEVTASRRTRERCRCLSR